MNVLRRRWKDPNWQCPHKEIVVVNTIERFWKRALNLLLSVAILAVIGMAILLLITKSSDYDASRKLKDVIENRNLTYEDLLKYSKMRYWRGTWATDDVFIYTPACRSDVKMITFRDLMYKEQTMMTKNEITYYSPECSTRIFGLPDLKVISWNMGRDTKTSYLTERTIFGPYARTGANPKKLPREIGQPHLCYGQSCFVAAVQIKDDNFRIMIQNEGEHETIIKDKRKHLFCGVQDTNVENYINFGRDYDKHYPIFINGNNVCLYVCYDMSDGPYSHEHTYIMDRKSIGAVLMKPNIQNISIISIHVFKIGQGKVTNEATMAELPDNVEKRSYFMGCQWHENYSTIVITSRDFTKTWYLSCPEFAKKCSLLWTNNWGSRDKYSDVLGAGFNDGQKLLTIIPHGKTSRLVSIDVKRQTVHPVTFNSWVSELVHWDKNIETVYYIATLFSNLGERYLFRLYISHSRRSRSYCLTCSNNKVKRSDIAKPACPFAYATFSPKGTHYLLDCLDGYDMTKMPETHIVHARTNRILKTIDTRKPEYEGLQNLILPKFRYYECPIAGNKYKARIKLILPPNFDPKSKYPLIMGVDASIGSQMVNAEWKLDIESYAAVTEHYIYLMTDVRGSGYQGYEFESELYKNIGEPEVDDQLEVLKWLIDKFSFIDRNNVFIQGEQYGGMVAILMMLKRPNLLKAVAAYHPPLFWIGSTAFFAERLLGLPTLSDNYYGYESKSIGENVYRYRNRKMLIVMDMLTNSGGHSQQLFMMRTNMNEEPYMFNFTNVIELVYGADVRRARHRIAYFKMMFSYFKKFKNYRN